MTIAEECMPIVLSCLRREHDMPLKASEIANWTRITPSAVLGALLLLKAEGRVSQNPLGYWELTPAVES